MPSIIGTSLFEPRSYHRSWLLSLWKFSTRITVLFIMSMEYGRLYRVLKSTEHNITRVLFIIGMTVVFGSGFEGQCLTSLATN